MSTADSNFKIANYVRPPPIKKFDICEFARLSDLNTINDMYMCATGAGRERFGSAVNSRKMTALHLAAEQGNVELCKFLVEKCCADVNALDDRSWSPLHSACSSGNSELCMYLIRMGGDVSQATTEGCIPLNYYVRHATDPNALTLIQLMSLLLPDIEVIDSVNDRGETLLHYACLNHSDAFGPVVLFLISNGIDSTIRNNMGYVAWNFISREQYSAIKDHISVDESLLKDANSKIPTPASMSSIPLPKGPPAALVPSHSRYEDQESDRIVKSLVALRGLLKEIESQKVLSEEMTKKVTEASSKVEQHIASFALFQSSTAHESTFGHRFADYLMEKVSLNLNNRTSRRLLKEGKAMLCSSALSQESAYIYYFMYNDLILTINEKNVKRNHKDGHVHIPRNAVRCLSLSEVVAYNIPPGCGMQNAFQIVHNSMSTIHRESLSFTVPTEEDKAEFLQLLKNAREIIDKHHELSPQNTPFPEEDVILKEGFLVRQDPVFMQFMRVYVRLTEDTLFYYDSKETEETLGLLHLQDLRTRFDSKHLAIRWCYPETGASYNFLAPNRKDFEDWKSFLEKLKHPDSSKKEEEAETNTSAGKIEITIHAGRDLPAMDTNGKSDPYCIFGVCKKDGSFASNVKKKTRVDKKTLTPHWKQDNSEVFRVDDGKGNRLGIRVDVWDEDTIKKDDFMGVVFLDPLVHFPTSGSVSQWYPLTSRPGKHDTTSGALYITLRAVDSH